MAARLPDVQQIEMLADLFETKTAPEIITWAVETYGSDIALSSSFQTDSIPLLDLVRQIKPDIRIFFLNTGMHFWQTLIFREQLERVWGLNIVDLYPSESWQNFLQCFGKDLPHQDSNLCCYIRKVHPMQKAMQGVRAWITGIRRDQTAVRAKARFIEVQKDGLVKINPMLKWTRAEVQAYIRAHHLPEHPLLAAGYPSIGCAPCTRPVAPGEDERAGRWAGLAKKECGLHTAMFNQDESQIRKLSTEFILKLESKEKAPTGE